MKEYDFEEQGYKKTGERYWEKEINDNMLTIEVFDYSDITKDKIKTMYARMSFEFIIGNKKKFYCVEIMDFEPIELKLIEDFFKRKIEENKDEI